MRASALISTLAATALSVTPSAFAQLSAAQKAEQVKDAFKFAWDGYYEYAFPNDELHPVSNTYGNSRNGWGASAADALSTAAIMELPDVVDQILEHLANVDFTKTTTSVSLFETTIRYLGGMISGYDLLKDEALSHLPSKPEQVDALLDQSRVLADVMKFAFNSTSGVPYNNIDIVKKTTSGRATNGLAVTGTLVLEWTRLSDLTGDPEYASLSQLAESYLLHPKPDWAEPYDGLVGSDINITSGEFVNARVSWSGGADSFYEYLLKMYVYDNEKFEFYGDRWEAAARSSIEVLFSETGEDRLVFMAELHDGDLVYRSQHLTCFDGGSFILGGQIFKNQDYLDAGLKLVDGCRATYAATATGIGPETFSWAEDEVPEEKADFYNREGFFITGSTYNMRPEVIESYYYAFRATGDEKYRDWAWDAFVAINATTRTSSGFSAIGDVNSPDGGIKLDNQESFLFAEVMKYLYLIFAPDDDWQVDSNGNNKYVYNTEAHPVKVAKTA